MSEISVKVDEKSELVFSDRTWQKEQTSRSSEPVILRGLVDGQQKGSLSASFEIKRRFDPQTGSFEEESRLVELPSISVWPGYQKRGLGAAMLEEIERLARHFGASKMQGKLGAADLEEKPWLKDFYIKRGFELEPKGAGYKLSKSL